MGVLYIMPFFLSLCGACLYSENMYLSTLGLTFEKTEDGVQGPLALTRTNCSGLEKLGISCACMNSAV